MSIKILVADDDQVVHESLGIYLQAEGFEPVDVYDGEAAVSAVDTDIALCVLDIMMPVRSGIEVCKEIRKTSQVPIIMLTAKGEEVDRIVGLELGADDYIVKPFGVLELLARINTVLRRAGKARDEDISAEYMDLTIDFAARQVIKNGEAIGLTNREYELFLYLYRNRGVALSRDTLLENVWGYDFGGETRTVDAHVRSLRQKLGDDGEGKSRYIITSRGYGYTLKKEPKA